jgi:ketosteroid isomerase-like protein
VAVEKEVIRQFSEYYEKKDLAKLVGLFTEDATYHDTFYGSFTGHAKIREMFEHFHRDGKDYTWDMKKVVAEPGAAMAEFYFSFVTTNPRNPGRNVRMTGVGIFDFRGGQINHYREYFDVGPALLQIGLAPEAVVRHLQKRLDRGASYTIPGTK